MAAGSIHRHLHSPVRHRKVQRCNFKLQAAAEGFEPINNCIAQQTSLLHRLKFRQNCLSSKKTILSPHYNHTVKLFLSTLWTKCTDPYVNLNRIHICSKIQHATLVKCGKMYRSIKFYSTGLC